MRRLLILTALTLLLPASAFAQVEEPDGDPRLDSLFARARQLVLDGQGDAGRAILDSVVAAIETDSPDFPEALFWRALLTPAPAEAERDYRRIIVEYPLARRSSDALFALGQLEMARGNRQRAIDHLQRLVRENPDHPERGRIGVWLTRLHFDENQLARACASLARTMGGLEPEAVEIRNQLQYFAPRCAGVDTTVVVERVEPPPPQRPAPVQAPAQPRARTPAPQARPPAAAPAFPAATAGRFALQVAAYNRRADAERLVATLSQRGIQARVAGVERPFRVRIGRFATRDEARAAQDALKERGQETIIVIPGPEDP